jgi:hypothetical protein
MQIHGSIGSALQHSSTWASFSALFAASASGLSQPWQSWCIGAGIGCGVLGVLLRAPVMDKDDEKDTQCLSN